MRRLILATLLVGGVMSTGILTGSALMDSAWAQGAERYASLDTLAQALHHIERHFVDEATAQDLIYGGIKGMTDTLDTHSTFLTPQEMKKAEARTEGWYTGIGVELGASDEGTLISRVIPDSPADQIGLKAGTLLVAVDGTPVDGLSLPVIGAMLRGKEGTLVQLTVQDPAGTAQTLKLERVRVRDKSVRLIPDTPGIPRIQIAHFQRNTAADLETALEGLARRKGKVRGLVLDLRDNPGGLLDEAVAVVDIFLDAGLIYETRGQNEQPMDRADAKPGSRWERTPLVILVNGRSASASEIVAGALQAHERAVVVGTPTYGKGSVQRLYVFEDGSALKLTVSRYHLANGKVVADDEGLQPDVTVTPPTKKSAAADRLSELVASLEAGPRAEARTLIQTLQLDKDIPMHPNPDPQLEAAWKIVHATR
jgi:carboxyl-terminal processing protease